MDDLSKLKKLLYHWMEHNEEHAETYREWSEKALALGNADLSDTLKNLYSESKKLNGLFEDAIKKIP